MPANSAPSKSFLVVDSWPVMEWQKEREPATSRFLSLLQAAASGDILLLLSSINLGEIYYNCWIAWDETRAEQVLKIFMDLPIDIIHPTQNDVIAAARIKGKYNISYADAFTAALAVDYEAPVLTGDKDFLKLQADDLLSVDWIQR